MRKVCYWLIVVALTAGLLLLVAPVVLTIAIAIFLTFYRGPLGGPWWLIFAALFALPLAAVVLIFRGTYRSLRGSC